MQRRNWLKGIAAAFGLAWSGGIPAVETQAVYWLRNDDEIAVQNTEAIQKAIDASFAAGGGLVQIPAGAYLVSGPIVLRNNARTNGNEPKVSRDIFGRPLFIVQGLQAEVKRD